jgi:hypothetical protein
VLVPAVTVRLSGGLGNQLFQYASARAMSLNMGAPLQLDVSFYRKGRHRNYELEQFPIQATVCSAATSRIGAAWTRFRSLWKRESLFREASFRYDPAIHECKLPVTLEGYFQSARYFETCANVIRSELAIPDLRTDESHRWAQRIQQCRSIIVHVRRGDYLTNKNAMQTFAACDMVYYRQALDSIENADCAFVFSDDIPWCKEHLPRSRSMEFIGDGSPRSGIEDLKLMSLGHHHIIANSSFSWWGAWLAGPSKGMTIAPKTWFVDPAMDDSDLIPQNWLRL